MTTTNKGLGKGLGALISMFDEDLADVRHAPSFADANATPFKKGDSPHGAGNSHGHSVEQIVPHGTLSTDGVAEIPLDLIDNNKDQPRKVFNDAELKELEQSIIANGVLQPILVNKVGTRYMIVAGERRWRASKNAGLKTIPALVREYSPKQIAEIALVENLMRADLNEIEIATGIKQLMDKHNMTQEQVARVLGKSRSALANSLRYLNLPTVVQQMLEKGEITAGHAKVLCGVTDRDKCISFAKMCMNDTMTVRELEFMANGRGENVPRGTISTNVPASAWDISPEMKNIIKLVTEKLGLKTTVFGTAKRGRISIDYTSQEELERILKTLGVKA